MSAVSAYERFKIKAVGTLEVSRATCWFFHKWTRWSHPDQKSLVRIGTSDLTGYLLTQHRHCERCGKYEFTSQQVSI